MVEILHFRAVILRLGSTLASPEKPLKMQRSGFHPQKIRCNYLWVLNGHQDF